MQLVSSKRNEIRNQKVIPCVPSLGIGRVEENNQLRELENVPSHLCADSVKRKRVTEEVLNYLILT